MIGSVHLGVESDTDTVSLTGCEDTVLDRLTVDPDSSVAGNSRVCADGGVGNRGNLKMLQAFMFICDLTGLDIKGAA